MSVKNPQLAGFLLTGNRSNFLYVEGSTAWLYDCPHFISPQYRADKSFDREPIHYRETIMYVDPITRQIFNYATPIECGNNPHRDIDDGNFYVLTPDLLNEKHHKCSNLLKLRQQKHPIHLPLKMPLYTQMQN